LPVYAARDGADDGNSLDEVFHDSAPATYFSAERAKSIIWHHRPVKRRHGLPRRG
jgi:hypothetical protein